MKARSVRKLRNRISKFKPYLIHELAFGALFGQYSDAGITIMADSFELAKAKFVRYDERRSKECSNYRDCYFETEREWGRLLIVDEKGNKKFYT